MRPRLRRLRGPLSRLAGGRPLVVVHGGGTRHRRRVRRRADRVSRGSSMGFGSPTPPRSMRWWRCWRDAINTALVAASAPPAGTRSALPARTIGSGWRRRRRHRTSVAGDEVDLGLVGQPVEASARLLADLLRLGYVPVIAQHRRRCDGRAAQRECRHVRRRTSPQRSARSRLIIAGGDGGRPRRRRTHDRHAVRRRRDRADRVGHGATRAWSRSSRPAAGRLRGGVASVTIVSRPRRGRLLAGGRARIERAGRRA